MRVSRRSNTGRQTDLGLYEHTNRVLHVCIYTYVIYAALRDIQVTLDYTGLQKTLIIIINVFCKPNFL